MSYRRKAPPSPELIPLDGKVVCTDKGRHPQVRISGFMDHPKTEEASDAGWTQTRNWDLIAAARPEGFTLRFHCKRCRRDMRLREDRAMSAFEALRQLQGNASTLVLDISLLPC